MERLTYKSSMGDYGNDAAFEDEWQEKCAYRNHLGRYEDLGYTPDELQDIIDQCHKLCIVTQNLLQILNFNKCE